MLCPTLLLRHCENIITGITITLYVCRYMRTYVYYIYADADARKYINHNHFLHINCGTSIIVLSWVSSIVGDINDITFTQWSTVVSSRCSSLVSFIIYIFY